MTEEMVDQEALDYALERVDDFLTVNGGREPDEARDAVEVLLDSMGITTELKFALKEWMVENLGRTNGSFLLGFLTGLFVAQYHRDEYS